MKRAYRVGALGAGLVAAALLVAGCGTGGVASAGARPDTANGETLFKANCAACHTLAAAGTTGTIGPNLDNAFAGDVSQGYPQSSIENVVLDQIRLGSGIVTKTYTTSKDFINQHCENDQTKCEGTAMPANIVKGQDAIDVAAYVASVAGQSGYTTPSGGSLAALGTDGEAIFKSPLVGCAGCHTLAAAGSTGTTGPNLDQLKPSMARVVTQVTNGGGVMPAFQGKLSPAQIKAVAKYVSSSAGK
ncbi:MAG TPA: c-type cytochrome [Gaiellaceae bacterium]|nr:c-type cytochrome [Gaiellaceae bacterium]